MKLTRTITLPPDAGARTIGIIGQKGSGKTYTAKRATEQMLEADVQVVCLDPTGVWWGLRGHHDSKGVGFEVIVMGGEHGDVPLLPTAGTMVADWIVSSGQSVVLDMSAFNSNAEQVRFVTDLMERLFRAKNNSRSPLHIMMDEADSFAPQRPMPGEQRMLGSIIAAVRRGRSRGLGMTMITQRPASLSKEVLSQVDLLIAMRVVGKHDHDALSEWTKLHGTTEQRRVFMERLPSLPVGEAFFWSPEWLTLFEHGQVLPCRTYDSSRTPEPGQSGPAPKLFKVDISKLSEEIQATADRARENDPAALKAEVARLKKELAAAMAAKPEPTIREVNVISPADVAELDRLVMALQEKGSKIIAALNSVSLARPAPKSPAVSPRAPANKPRTISTAASSAISAAHLRVLKALYWLRHEDTSPAQVAFYANYTVNGHFNNLLGGLRSQGLVAGWKITAEGEAQVPDDVEDKPTGNDLREWMREKLTSAENKILDVLINAGGSRVPVETLAADAGFTVNGHFNNSLGHLRTLQMAEGGAREGGVKAADVFFQS